jgi:hypothetical protein
MHADLGEAVGRMRGTLAHRSITTDAIITLSLRQSLPNIGSAKLFPQHCQVSFLSAKNHLQELTNKVVSTLSTMTADKQ